MRGSAVLVDLREAATSPVEVVEATVGHYSAKSSIGPKRWVGRTVIARLAQGDIVAAATPETGQTGPCRGGDARDGADGTLSRRTDSVPTRRVKRWLR